MEELNGKVVLNGKYSAKNKVNMPKLSHTGLTPVTIDGEGNIKDVTDEQIQKEDWYSYNTTDKKWANAKTADGSMWVWIPRFAYKISYTTEGDKSKGGTIEIVFLKGTTDEPVDGSKVEANQIVRANSTDAKDKYIVHPAFTDESSTNFANGGWDKEIPGFWIAKFEAGYVENEGSKAQDSPVKYTVTISWNNSQTVNTQENYYGARTANNTKIKWPTFQPFRPSFNYIGISDAYELCRQIGNTSAQNNPYKLDNVDSHLTKNSEWGAVAYLSYSKYGRGNWTDKAINSANAGGAENVWAVTGYSNSTNAVTTELSQLTGGSTAGGWNTAEGENASTNGNTSGVYDMSGGLWEWTAGYIAPSSGSDLTYGGKLKEENSGDSSRYKSKFESENGGTDRQKNYEKNKERLGEAIWETSDSGDESNSCWDGDFSGFVKSGQPFTIRGGYYAGGPTSGILAFRYDWRGLQ